MGSTDFAIFITISSNRIFDVGVLEAVGRHLSQWHRIEIVFQTLLALLVNQVKQTFAHFAASENFDEVL